MSPIFTENPEAAMCHAKARGDVFGGPNCMFLESCSINGRCVTAGSCEARGNPSGAFFDLPLQQRGDPTKWEWPTSESRATCKRFYGWEADKDNEVPGFDSEAHRAFLRSLG